jgi:hypothetical protein
MEFLKDGKYIIGFLIGVICSFVIMGGIKNHQGEGNLAMVPNNGDLVVDDKSVVGEDLEGVQTIPGITTKTQSLVVDNQNQTTMKPEDPHSPQLQRLDLILRETQRMVDRLKRDIRTTEIKNQTATLLNQN